MEVIVIKHRLLLKIYENHDIAIAISNSICAESGTALAALKCLN